MPPEADSVGPANCGETECWAAALPALRWSIGDLSIAGRSIFVRRDSTA
jgi:hypothetical protein